MVIPLRWRVEINTPTRSDYYPEGRLVHDAEAVATAIQMQAQRLRPRLEGRNPLVLVVMCGALYYASWLTLALAIPLELDYVHLGRYGSGRKGRAVRWERKPGAERLAGRTVLVVDDIFDEGVTLTTIAAFCREAGAREVFTAVLARKRRAHLPGGIHPPSSVALEVPDAFVVGCGLDDAGHWRNLPAIYALNEGG